MSYEKKIAEELNGREIDEEMKEINEETLKEMGIVVLFGYSDDNMEFRGAIHDEIGCYDGGKAFITRYGLVNNECDDGECPYFERLQEKATLIKANWCKGDIPWTYETSIPHETFNIMEEGTIFCRGIVFNLKAVE